MTSKENSRFSVRRGSPTPPKGLTVGLLRRGRETFGRACGRGRETLAQREGEVDWGKKSAAGTRSTLLACAEKLLGQNAAGQFNVHSAGSSRGLAAYISWHRSRRAKGIWKCSPRRGLPQKSRLGIGNFASPQLTAWPTRGSEEEPATQEDRIGQSNTNRSLYSTSLFCRYRRNSGSNGSLA